MTVKGGHPKHNNLLFFEYIEKGSNANDYVLKPVSAARAFRKYHWLKGEAALNKSGNLRGMVIDKRFRVVYNVSSKAGDFLAIVGMIGEVAKEMSRMRKVYDSKADDYEKASRILMLGSAAMLRSVTSIVPTVNHLISKSIQGYAMLYSALTGSNAGNKVSAAVGKWDRLVSTTHAKQWDGEVWYNVVSAHVR